MNSTQKKAVIYCRVSSRQQVTEGNGLDSQESRCRLYAKTMGYDVVKVFKEEGISGGIIERPEIQALLEYIRKNGKEYIVVFDDISRLARGLGVHTYLMSVIRATGASIESPSMKFEESPSGKLVEHMLVSMAEFQREHNKEQVNNRMRARAREGYYMFGVPLCYTHNEDKELVRIEPLASILKEAIEGYEKGRFNSLIEIQDFLNNHNVFLEHHKKIHISFVERLLKSETYTGHFAFEKWDIPYQKWKIEPIISIETYRNVQAKLKNKGHVAVVPRKDIQDAFPLRGFVVCGECGDTYTASFSKGKTKRYAYYGCKKRGCKEYGESISKAQLEGDFEMLY